MKFGNIIPPWSYSRKKESQSYPLGDPSGEGINPHEQFPMDESRPPRMIRYRGTMMYEIEVPEQADKEQEQQLADAKAHDLWQQIWDRHGDSVPTQELPNRIG